MAAQINEITHSNPPDIRSDREILLDIDRRLTLLEAEHGQMTGRLGMLLGAWATGGLRGLRKAASDGRD